MVRPSSITILSLVRLRLGMDKFYIFVLSLTQDLENRMVWGHLKGHWQWRSQKF